MRTNLILCLALLALNPYSTQAGQEPARLQSLIPVETDYLLYLPETYEDGGTWPLVLFLHGAGERGNDLEKVKIHGPPKQVAEGRTFPFILVSPQCDENVWWEPIKLAALLDQVVDTHRVDTDRIYVTGLSMGGYGTWALACYQPDRFAAIAPICGGGIEYRTRNIPHLPVWVFHGAKDSVVTLDKSEAMVAALRKHGGDPKLTVYPDAGHDAWTETYNNPEFYRWLLSHTR